MAHGPLVTKISLDPAMLGHLAPDQYGALVAWIMKSPNFYEISVRTGNIEISFKAYAESPKTAQNWGDLALEIQQIYDQIEAFVKLDPFPCPCGCGAFIAITPCFRQSELDLVLNNGLTRAEMNEAQSGDSSGKIRAIKMVRIRTGLGLKEAKDLVDKVFPLGSAFNPYR